MSLLFIGLVTAVVGDAALMLGCAMDIPDEITGEVSRDRVKECAQIRLPAFGLVRPVTTQSRKTSTTRLDVLILFVDFDRTEPSAQSRGARAHSVKRH